MERSCSSTFNRVFMEICHSTTYNKIILSLLVITSSLSPNVFRDYLFTLSIPSIGFVLGIEFYCRCKKKYGAQISSILAIPLFFAIVTIVIIITTWPNIDVKSYENSKPLFTSSIIFLITFINIPIIHLMRIQHQDHGLKALGEYLRQRDP